MLKQCGFKDLSFSVMHRMYILHSFCCDMGLTLDSTNAGKSMWVKVLPAILVAKW